MNTKRTLWPILLILLFSLCLSAGCKPESGTNLGPNLKISPVELSSGEKDFLLSYAKARLTGGSAPDAKAFPNLTAAKDSALFLSIMRPATTADLCFASGKSVLAALDGAIKELSAKKSLPLTDARLRIDLVAKVRKPIQVGKKIPPKFSPTVYGLYFRTDPPVAFHPLELVSRGVFREKGPEKDRRWEFEIKGLKTALALRGLPESLAAPFNSSEGVNARPFDVVSFMEGPDGKGFDLVRWSAKEIPLTPELIYNRCVLAGKYLASALDENGRFDYRYMPEVDKSESKYNLLRHCGTTYSLAQLYELTKDPVFLDATKRAIEFVIKNNLVGPRDKDKEAGFKCIKGEGYKDQTRDYCKLGGGGLFLVALSTYTRATGDMTYLPVMQELARFIQFMQKPDGEMEAKYYFNDLPHKHFVSLFYPGEASYGLGLLYPFDKNMGWIDVGHKAVNWLHEQRKGTVPWKLPVDHWLCIAMNELYKAKKNEDNKQHVFDIAKGMIQTQRIELKDVPQPDLLGGWGSRPQSSANGTRVEGLVAVYHLAGQSGDDPEPFLAAAWNAANMLVRMQLTDAGNAYFPKPGKVVGGFVDRINCPQLQIDNTQHCLSALIGIYRIMEERGWKTPDTETYLKWRAEYRP